MKGNRKSNRLTPAQAERDARNARLAVRRARRANGEEIKLGRPKGSKNRISRAMLTALAQTQKSDHPLTPLAFMLDVLGNVKNSFTRRSWAAAAAAPYMHRRMPLAIEGGDPSRPLIIATVDRLKTLTPEELAVLVAVQAKLVGGVPAPDDVMKLIADTVEKEIDGEREK